MGRQALDYALSSAQGFLALALTDFIRTGVSCLFTERGTPMTVKKMTATRKVAAQKAAKTRARQRKTQRIAKIVIVGIVALITAIVSFGHIYHVCRVHGQSPLVSGLMPFTIDGLMLACTMMLGNWRATVGLFLGIVATMAANYLAVDGDILDHIVSMWPAITLLATTEVILHGGKKTHKRSRRSPATTKVRSTATSRAPRGFAPNPVPVTV